MNVVDLVAVTMILLAAFLGLRSGLIAQAFGLLGAVAGIALLVAFGGELAAWTADLDAPLRLVAVVVAIVLAIALGEAIGGAVARGLHRRIGVGLLHRLDQLGGASLGAAQGVLVVWLASGLIAASPSPTLAAEARRSTVVRELDDRFPSPVIVMAELARAIEASGLPALLEGAPPPAPPVAGPGEREAERIAAAARSSTARVEAVACDRLLSGTGFAVAPGYVVTNAHVVAGAVEVELSLDGRLERHDATVVDFDAELDAALLHAPTLPLEPLRLAESAPERGTRAAALGHTGGGRLRVIPAGVTRSFEAAVRLDDGLPAVARGIVELQASVSPGDSGGPLVLADGTVGGVIFSESRADSSIGYALAPDEVERSIGDALGRTDAVDVGPCRSR